MITAKNQIQIDSELIVTLAKQALNNLPHVQHYCDQNDERQFRKEFGTVKIAMPRQSGHSTAALQLMYEYPDALCFVHSGSAKQYIRHLMKDYISDQDVIRRITANIMVPDQRRMLDIRPVWTRSFVIMDQCSMISNEMQDYIRESLQRSILLELG